MTCGRPCEAETWITPAGKTAALAFPGVEWADISDCAVCVLEAHAPETPHQGLVCELQCDQAVWVYWGAGHPLSELVLRTDCPATGRDGGCSGYVGHPGRHTFELPYPLGAD